MLNGAYAGYMDQEARKWECPHGPEYILGS